MTNCVPSASHVVYRENYYVVSKPSLATSDHTCRFLVWGWGEGGGVTMY